VGAATFVGVPSEQSGAAGWQPGDILVVQERWRGHLWSAVPHVAVAAGEGYVTYVPSGTAATYASSIGVPGRDHLPRSERKLLAMQTCVYEVVERYLVPAALHFFTPGSWARVSLGWEADGMFMGWYVNFERPVTATPDGLQTMDLVLDMIVRPDRTWDWKDRTEFDEAVRRGVLDAGLLETLETEAEGVLARMRSRTGPFDESWSAWRADPGWVRPVLPPEFQVDGHRWRRL
jgi:protein associated with RNAse G/E